MNRIRKISNLFHHKGSTVSNDHQEYRSSSKPVYRGTKPLTVSDIHSHSPVDQTRMKGDLDYYYDDFGTPYPPSNRRDSEDSNFSDILGSFPAPPAFQAIVSTAHNDGGRFYFPPEALFSDEDLLPPPPPRVLEMAKERARALQIEANSQKSSTSLRSSSSSSRRPLYANAHANLSTRSLGAHIQLKTPTPQRTAVLLPSRENNASQSPGFIASPPPSRAEVRRALSPIPEGRQRLRSAPSKATSLHRSGATRVRNRGYSPATQY